MRGLKGAIVRHRAHVEMLATQCARTAADSRASEATMAETSAGLSLIDNPEQQNEASAILRMEEALFAAEQEFSKALDIEVEAAKDAAPESVKCAMQKQESDTTVSLFRRSPNELKVERLVKVFNAHPNPGNHCVPRPDRLILCPFRAVDETEQSNWHAPAIWSQKALFGSDPSLTLTLTLTPKGSFRK